MTFSTKQKMRNEFVWEEAQKIERASGKRLSKRQRSILFKRLHREAKRKYP